LLYPSNKFLSFQPTGKSLGPGALGLPNGIIPCNKYLVEQNGISYAVCTHNNIIVYEEYFNNEVFEEVSLRPTLEVLELVPIITDPAPPATRAGLTTLMIAISIASIHVFMRRDEVRVL
jgi:hypothetical protein